MKVFSLFLVALVAVPALAADKKIPAHTTVAQAPRWLEKKVKPIINKTVITQRPRMTFSPLASGVATFR